MPELDHNQARAPIVAKSGKLCRNRRAEMYLPPGSKKGPPACPHNRASVATASSNQKHVEEAVLLLPEGNLLRPKRNYGLKS